MIHALKVLRDVRLQNPSPVAVGIPVLAKERTQTIQREVGAFAHPARRSVVDEHRVDVGGQRMVAERVLNHTVAIRQRFDAPYFRFPYLKNTVRAGAIAFILKSAPQCIELCVQFHLKQHDFRLFPLAAPRAFVGQIKALETANSVISPL